MPNGSAQIPPARLAVPVTTIRSFDPALVPISNRVVLPVFSTRLPPTVNVFTVPPAMFSVPLLVNDPAKVELPLAVFHVPLLVNSEVDTEDPVTLTAPVIVPALFRVKVAPASAPKSELASVAMIVPPENQASTLLSVEVSRMPALNLNVPLTGAACEPTVTELPARSPIAHIDTEHEKRLVSVYRLEP